MPGVRLEISGAIGKVILDRPEQRNALDLDARLELAEAFRTLDGDPAIRVAVLTGAGTAFCAGTDLSGSQDPEHPLITHPQRLAQPLDDFTKPLIAAVNGAAAGWIRAGACRRPAHRKPVRQVPSAGGLNWQPSRKRGHPADLLGPAFCDCRRGSVRRPGAHRRRSSALRTGERRLSNGGVHGACECIGGPGCRQRPLSLIAGKKAARAARDGDGAGLELERSLWAQLSTTWDREEGIAAFREKRPPRFEGR